MSSKIWTPDEIQYLLDHYEHNHTAQIAQALGRTERSVYAQAHARGLKKAYDIYRQNIQPLLQSGRSHRFKPGQVPHNKGIQMPDHVRKAVSATWFPKGNIPHNARPEGNGALSFRKCKGAGYWYIRLELGRWRQLHTHIWEQANRPINPKTEMIKFIDGNPHNCQLENLYLCTRAENMRANTIHRYPTPLKEAIRAHNKLNRLISEHEK